MNKENTIGITDRRLARVGGSIMVPIPKEWLSQNNLSVGEKVTILSDVDLIILSPERKQEVYKKFKNETI